MEQAKEIRYELKSPFLYNPGSGGEIEACFITLEEPTGKVSHLCCHIESLVQSGILEMSNKIDPQLIKDAQAEAKEKGKNEEDEGHDADSVLAIMMGGGVDMKKMVVTFQELFKEVALIGGEKTMTDPALKKMKHKDFRQMMAVYAANFILD